MNSKNSILIENVSYIDENFNVVKNSFVGIRGKFIDYISKEKPIKKYDKIIDGKMKVLMPGLINTHCHVPMTILRGYGEELPLYRWLNEKIFPMEAKFNEEFVYWGSMLGIAEMLKSGITSFSDMYMNTLGICKAVDETGIKCNVSQVITNNENKDLEQLECFKYTEKLFKEYKNHECIKIDTSLHAEYSTTMPIVRDMAIYTKEKECVLQIHVSETKNEVSECKARHKGKTPVQYFYDNNIFNNKVLLSHCVHIENNDLEILRNDNVYVSHCPISNLKLGSGIAPINKMLEHKINVTIGTDGAASNNNLFIIEDLKLASLLQKGVNLDPTVCDMKTMIKMITKLGAEAQNREKTGLIKEGYFADLVLFDMNNVNLQPIYNEITNIIYSSQPSDIFMTMVNGKILYMDNEFFYIDIDKIYYNINKIKEKILR